MGLANSLTAATITVSGIDAYQFKTPLHGDATRIQSPFMDTKGIHSGAYVFLSYPW